jgi:putative transposase
MDFVSDSLADGRRFRALAIVDNFSRESVAIEAGVSMTGKDVAAILDGLGPTRKLPRTITVDNGPEFTSKALDQWCHWNGVRLDFIRPGKPVENAFAESFIGRLRQECLNQTWFVSIEETREKLEQWRKEYNGFRPHRSLGNKTPRDFLAEYLNPEPCEEANLLT